MEERKHPMEGNNDVAKVSQRHRLEEGKVEVRQRHRLEEERVKVDRQPPARRMRR